MKLPFSSSRTLIAAAMDRAVSCGGVTEKVITCPLGSAATGGAQIQPRPRPIESPTAPVSTVDPSSPASVYFLPALSTLSV